MSQSKLFLETDCTKFCHSHQHGSLLTAAITKRAISDCALSSFFRCTCQNFLRVLDNEGRSVIHMTASRGRISLLEWLIQHCPSNHQGINLFDIRDLESGYTPLHRSVFYGEIHAAVTLMKHGANTTIFDNEDMTPIDIALLDRHPKFKFSLKPTLCDVYIWGANSNYTLGTSSQHQRNYPELLTIFSKHGQHIKQVCLNKFHSIFVTHNGNVWSCGHGEGGRLGIATSDTRVLPTPISLNESCIQAATGRDHSLFLLQSGIVLSCGLNDYHQLGQVPPPKSQLSPKPIKLRLSSMKGIYAGRYHSVAYNAHTLYTWGLNGGQLGHLKEDGKTIVIPKKVPIIGNNQEDCTLEYVAVSDGATVVTTSKGDIYLLNQYKSKRIAYRLHNVKNIKVIGGEAIGGDKLNDQQKALSILMLNSVGNIYLWEDTSAQLTKCIFNLNRPLCVTEAVLTRDILLITTKYGEAFQGSMITKKISTNKFKNNIDDNSPSKEKGYQNKYFHQAINKDECYLIKLKRLPNIHRAVSLSCDSKANNFAVLQMTPNINLLQFPHITVSQMKEDFLTLLDEASEYDILHDVILKVSNQIFPAHQYIISHGSEYFAKLFMEEKEKNINSEKPVIQIENVHPIIFKQILIFIYSGMCDLSSQEFKNFGNNLSKNSDLISSDIEIDKNISAFEANIFQNIKNKKQNEKKDTLSADPVRLLQAAAKLYGIPSLHKLLDNFIWSNGNAILKNNGENLCEIKNKFDRNVLTELWDTHIKCSDGSIIHAHKCVLAARLEYFNGMFCHSWTESSTTSIISIPISKKFLLPIIDFLYTDACDELNRSEDFEYLGNMLIICDQFFIKRMREMCEAALSNMLSLKNVTEILQISDVYNCPQLKKCCLEYISLNISCLFENKSLENMSSKLLNELSNYYKEFNPIMANRVITPFSNSPTDELINLCFEVLPIDLTEASDIDALKDIDKEINSGKKKIRIRKPSNSENEKSNKKENKTFTSPNKNHVELITNNNYIENEYSEWTQVSTNQHKQKQIQARLKAINLVKENPSSLEQRESFIKLYKNSITNHSPNNSPNRSSSESPHQINESSNNTNTDHYEEIEHSPKTELHIKIMNTKLSQKQRKKLLSENNKQSNNSDMFKNDMELTNKENNIVHKNPWKKLDNIPNTPVNSAKVNFNEILEDQRKRKENFSKMKTKSLLLTQIEDQAIEELTKFYHSTIEDNECITVKRVPCTQIAAPQWITKSFKNYTIQM